MYTQSHADLKGHCPLVIFRAYKIVASNWTMESALECQEKCQDHNYCQVFSFDRVSHECLLHSVHHKFAGDAHNVGVHNNGFYNITWVTGPKFCDNCA